MAPDCVTSRRDTRHHVPHEFFGQLLGAGGQGGRGDEVVEVAGALGWAAVGPGKHPVVLDFHVQPDLIPIVEERGDDFPVTDTVRERKRSSEANAGSLELGHGRLGASNARKKVLETGNQNPYIALQFRSDLCGLGIG